MKKLLLSIVCAFVIFSLSAQITENFSDYTVGGKIASQAQAMGRDYWTTWSNNPGSSEDGSVAEFEGDKVASLVANNDQVLLFGTQTAGVYDIVFNMYVPSGKVGYFNVLSSFAGSSSSWAMQVYVNALNDGQNTTYSPGQGTLHAAGAAAATFSCGQEIWIEFKVNVDLDNDLGTFYVNGTQIHQWQWSLGSFGDDNMRQLDAMNIYCDAAANMEFYADNFAFTPQTGSQVLFETSFDDVANGAHVAVSYPDWFTTWSNAPGGAEDGYISNEQSSSNPQSAKFTYGNDQVLLLGNQTSGAYTVSFEVFVPTGKDGYFNILHSFAGSSSEWGIEVYLNHSSNGTVIKSDGADYPFTIPMNQWFPVVFDIDLDNDYATATINGTEVCSWAFSTQASGGAGIRQLGAMDFFPPSSASVSQYYIDNLVFASAGGTSAPNLSVSATSFTKTLASGDAENDALVITNSGNSIGDYVAWVTYDDAYGKKDGAKGTYTLAYSSDENAGAIGYTTGTPLIEYGAKFTGNFYGDFMGTELTKVSFFAYAAPTGNTAKIRVYGQGSFAVPGEVLAEVTTNSIILNYWNEVTLPEAILLDGQDYWVTVEMTQPEGAYLMAYDDGTAVTNSNWARTNSGAWGETTVVGGNNIGCWMIKAISEGTPIAGSWLTITNDAYGSIMGGENATLNLLFNAQGLSNGQYTAVLHIQTNDENNPFFEIPCTLNVGAACDAPVITAESSTYEGEPVVLVEWQAVTGAGSYNVYYGNTLLGNTVETSIAVTGVEIGTEYCFTVTSVCEGTESAHSNEGCALVGIEETESYFNMYPNPTEGNATITSNEIMDKVVVYNSIGQMVRNMNVNSTECIISDLNSGMYFIKVQSGETVKTLKLVVK
ncbi:MAG: T9SS type A sorting domain-containing protein [Bacteroidales bacterium]|jgi:hypothetical protein|nr:T9SS type A sorting domain-containing protein [Bacteroidales bacterium]MDD2204679.1 T9SS type A sorting domain-containing protein [Bacteroidales bacterium]MDD3151766.1 T9SS type A sorting domain-containing protein [Bacteroidales bacterium]MDD3914092.1 T9SS type A sorting domain-containing protein [Bacteroidales bacterium]MDD4634006.1 T9SS type A sorting domain-containing protein [Bacteroidales bacterium]